MFPGASRFRATLLAVICACLLSGAAAAQTCLTASDMDAAARSALESAAMHFYRSAAGGDYAGLRQGSTAGLASSFGPDGQLTAAVGENRPNLQGAQAGVRASYMLEATANLARGEFICGIANSGDSVGFLIPNLSVGRYGVVILDVRGGKTPLTFTEILQQAGNAWQLGGLYLRPAQIAGHDGNWYLTQARAYKSKGQAHNSWFYYMTAWTLLAPVDFMSTAPLERVSEEMQGARPAGLPGNNSSNNAPQDLLAGGKTYKLTQMFATPVGDNLDLVVKYQTPSVDNTSQSFQDNTAVIKALVAKYPELREAFSAVVARAVAPNGSDYGTVLAMKDVK